METTGRVGGRVELRAVDSGKKLGRRPRGLSVTRCFTRPGEDPFDAVEWELRSAKISNERGEIVFEQTDVEIPKSWSQLATNVVVSKYFRGHVGTPEREHSVKQLIGRVVGRIREWGEQSGYFRTPEDAQAFSDELTHVLVTQRMAFNSPVWFNLGVKDTPQQASACFINSVEDTMESIMSLAKTEAMLFKGGSGAGSNLSRIRSSKERLAGGGTASGPVSFMRGFDAFAGVVKSGGKTRRAAKMVILNADHPDILEFIRCKSEEEKKAGSLIDAGYDGGFNVPGGAYDSVFYQNANHSVRVTDAFMHSAQAGASWQTRSVTTGEVIDTFQARDVLREMAAATHVCGDPGVQFDTTINRWNPVKVSGRIHSSNPCSEYMFLDDTACNLASLNLMRFLAPDGRFEVETFRHAVALTILAQEILVDHAAYPTPQIERNSHLFRPLGLGYANLGALLMASGLPYDGDVGRNYAASITSLMCGEAYRASAEIAEAMGPFARYRQNRDLLPPGDRDAQGGGGGGVAGGCARGPARRRARELGAGAQRRPAAWLQERAGHGARAHGHDRIHDGLRHHGRRARPLAGQVQEAGGGRPAQDRERHRADGAASARLRGGRDRAHRGMDRRARDDRRRSGSGDSDTCRCSTARSGRRTACAASSGWATCA